MMSRHFALSSELTGAIAKRLPHAINQLSARGAWVTRHVSTCFQTYFINSEIAGKPTSQERWSCKCAFDYASTTKRLL